MAAPLDLNNIQGDILEGLSKKKQSFFFFRINTKNIAGFQKQLRELIPLITTAAKAKSFRNDIKEARDRAAQTGRHGGLLINSAINISFSYKGIEALKVPGDINDGIFKAGMRADVDNLADDIKNWDPKFTEDIHGVFLVAANSHHELQRAWDGVKHIFHIGGADAGVEIVKELDGLTRPGAEDGHEHFGFNDGLSQPAVEGVTTDAEKQPGQEFIRQGIALVGREGDNGDVDVTGTPSSTPLARPPWALDGSFLAFRYLRQMVPEFHAFLEANALKVPIPILPGDPNGAELLGARLVGRWPSGAPIDLTPLRDNPSLAVPAKNQDFRFDPKSQERCPYAAHLRKTNPRSDLDGLGGTELRRILRRGIPFGPEVTEEEKCQKKSSNDERLERGLLFACYQSNLFNGFQFIQKNWVNNAGFPPQKADAKTPGLDPLIGQSKDANAREMVGSDPKVTTSELKFPSEFVVSRGGEYFFSPSIPALKTFFAKSA